VNTIVASQFDEIHSCEAFCKQPAIKEAQHM